MLKQRILTAILLAPIVLAIIIYANNLYFSLFTGFLVLMISYEWCQIVKNTKVNSLIISTITALTVVYINQADFIIIEFERIFLAALILWLIGFIWLTKPKAGINKYTIKYALGVGILLLFGASLISVHQFAEVGVKATLILFALVWVADIGAYVAGKAFGKHKLAKQVSPGKTIEGLVGGLFFTAILGYFAAMWLQADWKYFVVAFPIIAFISVIGDLFASLLKRHANIKDSGFLLPGHGGFLDRFDSLIAATPFYFGFLSFSLNL
ncbi:MAG: phosphatidate cytidylyltransferase [Marinicellaceae bacterium]